MLKVSRPTRVLLNWRTYLMAGAAVLSISATGAVAQSTATVADTTNAGPEKSAHIDIPAGSLSKALTFLGRETQSEISFGPEAVKGKNAPALQGDYTVAQALDKLIAGKGLLARKAQNGAWIILVLPKDAAPTEGVPEVTVQGKKKWTMNTGIRRTQDDTQPYVIFSQDDIGRSGATNLEDFFRDNLPSNVQAATSDEAGNTKGQGLSAVNLRGLGANETLILIDGRRVTSANNAIDAGRGFMGQTQITGIALASIERIEVLASSASGIYGSNAPGGVINIILKRDYKGGDVTATHRRPRSPSSCSRISRGKAEADHFQDVQVRPNRRRPPRAGKEPAHRTDRRDGLT